MPAQQQLPLPGTTSHSLGGATLNWWFCFCLFIGWCHCRFSHACLGTKQDLNFSYNWICPQNYQNIISNFLLILLWLWSGPGSYDSMNQFWFSRRWARWRPCQSLPRWPQQLECRATERKDKSLVASLVSAWYSCSICAAAETTDGQERGKAVVQCTRHTPDSAKVLGCCS